MKGPADSLVASTLLSRQSSLDAKGLALQWHQAVRPSSIANAQILIFLGSKDTRQSFQQAWCYPDVASSWHQEHSLQPLSPAAKSSVNKPASHSHTVWHKEQMTPQHWTRQACKCPYLLFALCSFFSEVFFVPGASKGVVYPRLSLLGQLLVSHATDPKALCTTCLKLCLEAASAAFVVRCRDKYQYGLSRLLKLWCLRCVFDSTTADWKLVRVSEVCINKIWSVVGIDVHSIAPTLLLINLANARYIAPKH